MNPHTSPSPDAILQTAFGFWGSKVLLTAVEFGLFTTLGDRRLTGSELGGELGLHPRGIADFFDALVSMNFLDRDGDGVDALYYLQHGCRLAFPRSLQPALHRRYPGDA
jgi:Dimerisation domain